ncbi:hypothetical protein JQ604_14845 [Bradyrhizobium jicamae]|uniref:hypothetical protein n=1 Tax=Bradyrhizobium jicamae TaxID=280332 RepID=UPI001BA79151|nr:hypothetical protein [Bradyrhizobium jicamae]MBR0753463.1 hypothetical protein [Bradyrhizobium jicamae]
MLYSSHFWIGLCIGLIGGGSSGAMIMAMMAMAKDSNHWPPGPDEPHLDHGDVTLVPGAGETPRHFTGERHYRR